MVKRPSDQAKLLFFALLRSTAALATTGEKTRGMFPAIQLRFATRTDVPSIQRCNLACLPENYNQQFYANHLRQWPDLALVAEQVTVPAHLEHYDEVDGLERIVAPTRKRLFGSNFLNPISPSINPTRSIQGRPAEPKIVAYVLGKVESRPLLDLEDPTGSSSSTAEQYVDIGHVTSLAVQQDYRRLGLAKAMMTQLHQHLANYRVQTCGLHVRTSNKAACRLYQEDGYEISRIIPSYYQDGEDAYFMCKMLAEGKASVAADKDGNRLYGSRIWKQGPKDLRLPRIHDSLPEEGKTSTPPLVEEESTIGKGTSTPSLLTMMGGP